VDYISAAGVIPPNSAFCSENQHHVRKVLKSPKLKTLLKDHLLIRSDKNMGTAMVSLSWEIDQCALALGDRQNYSLIQTGNPNLVQFKEHLRTKAIAWLNIHLPLFLVKHIKPDGMEKLSGFYMIPKIHKNPVAGRPIYVVHISVTSLASVLALKILTEIHMHIKATIHSMELESFYLVYLSTNKAIAHTHIAHHVNLSETSYFHSRDFMLMYPNLNLAWCIDAILNLATRFGKATLDATFSVVFGRRHRQDFNPTIWYHLESLEDLFKLKISLKTLAILLRFILLEFTNLRCDFIPRVWKQVCGFAMSTNCAFLTANLTVTNCELDYAISLTVPCLSPLFYASRYINNLFFVLHQAINPPALESLVTLLNVIYEPAGLTSVAGGTSSDNVVHLDVQYPCPQSIGKDLRFGMYRKLSNCYQYPHFDLCINPSIKTSQVVFEAWRIVWHFHSAKDCAREFLLFLQLLEFRDYPPSYPCRKLKSFMRKVLRPKNDPDYRIVLNYCENIDQSTLANSLRLLDPAHTI
jgi:hypothetical protein